MANWLHEENWKLTEKKKKRAMERHLLNTWNISYCFETKTFCYDEYEEEMVVVGSGIVGVYFGSV